MVLNVGGIANLSLLLPGTPVRGFDTGPGNMLMDAGCGATARSLTIRTAAGPCRGGFVYRCCSRCWRIRTSRCRRRKAPAASILISRLERQLAGLPAMAPVDVQATLTELTAVSISEQVLLAGGCERLLVCGGGARNVLLMARLSALLPGTEVGLTDDFGVSGDDMEALAFARLAFRTLSGRAGNLPSVTGASRETVLGGIYPVLPLGPVSSVRIACEGFF